MGLGDIRFDKILKRSRKKMDRVLIQTDNKSYVRDLNSKALLQTNRKDADEYTVKTKMVQSAKNNTLEIAKMKEEIVEIKTSISEILRILRDQ